MNGLCTDPGALREGNLNWRLKGKEIKLKWKVGICVYKKKKNTLQNGDQIQLKRLFGREVKKKKLSLRQVTNI